MSSPHPASTSPPPQHIAVIMDGNGRWAKARGLPRVAGHKAGADALRRTIEATIRAGVGWLTIYAFSSENWRRSPEEVLDLTGLLRHYLRHEVGNLARDGVRLRFIGDRSRFDADIAHELMRAEQKTAQNSRLNLNVALSYGGRDEIAAACRTLAQQAVQGEIEVAGINEDAVGRALFTVGMPDPDLLIRTGGEQRLSNFLLWQAAYTEFVFLDCLWPDFGAQEFSQAVDLFARRERRFGTRPD